MGVESFIENMRSRLDTAACSRDLLNSIAAEISSFFSVRTHEIGIFSVNRKKHEINFLWPEGMTNTGHIPLNAVNSLVARTANELVTTLDNSFAKSRHLFMFEHMLAEKSDRITIQKIISVPVVADGEAKAVIQVVRKGKTQAEAGDDFSEHDLADLVKIASLLSAYNLQTL
jgi:hypothetical protein